MKLTIDQSNHMYRALRRYFYECKGYTWLTSKYPAKEIMIKIGAYKFSFK